MKILILSFFIGGILYLVGFYSAQKDISSYKHRLILLISSQVMTFISFYSIMHTHKNISNRPAYLVLLLFLTITSISDIISKIVKNYLILLTSLTIIFTYIFNNSFTPYLIIQGFSSFLFMYTILLISKGKLGGADVKMFFPIGMVVGLLGSLNILFLSAFVSLFVILILGLIDKNNLKLEIPFFPFILVGSLLNLYINILNI